MNYLNPWRMVKEKFLCPLSTLILVTRSMMSRSDFDVRLPKQNNVVKYHVPNNIA